MVKHFFVNFALVILAASVYEITRGKNQQANAGDNLTLATAVRGGNEIS